MRTFQKYFSMLLFTAMICAIFAVCASADEAEAPAPAGFDLPTTVTTVKVGLCFESTAVDSATLENSAGAGYYMGYYDLRRNFAAVGSTGEKSVTVRGDTGYHILLADSFESREGAASVAKPLGGFAAYINNEYRVCVGTFETQAQAEEALSLRGFSGAAFSGSGQGTAVFSAESGKILFLFDCGTDKQLSVKPQGGDAAAAWFNGNLYSGALELSRYDNGLTVVNYVNIEDYVNGVLPYEMMSSWPQEALKAQAVCARTYVLNNINEYCRYGFDVRNDTYSQVYRGLTDTNDATKAAAEATSGQTVRYGGAVCKVYYMSSSGGATESGANVFAESRDYLKAVEDPYEDSVNYYARSWTVSYTAGDIAYILNRSGYEVGQIESVSASYSDAGNVIELTVTHGGGQVLTLRNDECFRALNLNSLRYTISEARNADGGKAYVFSGSGLGHNCGMSQWGAYAMAENYNLTYEDIIGFYFSGAYVA